MIYHLEIKKPISLTKSALQIHVLKSKIQCINHEESRQTYRQ